MIETTIQTFQHTIRMMLFNQFKTNNPFIDGFITTIVLLLLGKLFEYYDQYKDTSFNHVYKTIMQYLYRPNKIIITGQNCSIPSNYGEFYVSSVYSDRFHALIEYIVSNNNNTVHEIKELFSNMSNNDQQKQDPFIVCQRHRFSIDENIFFTISSEMDNEEGPNKTTRKVEKLTIEIFSYTLSVWELTKYVDNITLNYRQNIYEDRKTKQFIYNAIKTTLKEDESKYDLWEEHIFVSNRNFSNLFLENKKGLLDKIDFFLENKSWFDERGIPYNLGIGLHGPPGTGKTSFIKALANKTKRDIIILPLKLIKTKTDLDRLFYETTYNSKNDKNSKTFDKKIIVFEDIDCIGDIVKKRSSSYELCDKPVTPPPVEKTTEQQLLNSIHSALEKNNAPTAIDPKIFCTDPLTLDDFLNLWDGIRETPGRIIIITSNHYDQLDPALIRPGRIDLTYEFKNVSHDVLQEMHQCFFHKTIMPSVICKIPAYKWSPAEIVNFYVKNRDNETEYLNAIQQV